MAAEAKKPKEKETGDRRRSLRLRCAALACSCSVGRTGDDPLERSGALLSDISADGISFETDFEAGPGERLRIEIRPIEGPDLAVGLEVIHTRRSNRRGFFLIGSRFEDMDERDRRSLLVLLETISRLEKDLSET